MDKQYVYNTKGPVRTFCIQYTFVFGSICFIYKLARLFVYYYLLTVTVTVVL